MPKFALTTYDGRVYTHRTLFKIAERALERAKANQRDFDSRLAATLFAALAVEAYINLMIEQIAPAIFAKERAYFSGKHGYSGLRGKVRWVLARLKVQKPERIETAYRRVLELIELRNEIAHTKPIAYEGRSRHSVNVEPPIMEARWIEDRVTIERTIRHVGAVERFCEWLNKQAAPRLTDPHLKRSAFQGTSQAQVFSSTTLSAALAAGRVRRAITPRPRLP